MCHKKLKIVHVENFQDYRLIEKIEKNVMLLVLLAKMLWYVDVNNLEVLDADAELWVMLPP